MTRGYFQIGLHFSRYLQFFGVIIFLSIMLAGGIIGSIFMCYLILYTAWRLPVIVYLIWIWCTDRNICYKGGRPLECIRDLSCWRYMRDYFPITMKKSTEFELDSKRNYLFCCFPHGIVGTGFFCAFCTNACGIRKLFPNHSIHVLTLTLNFFFPINRDIFLALGSCSVSARSINHILGKREGGNIASIAVGGAKEAFNSLYKIVLRNRKGFVRLALKNGAPLVPVISFGESEIYTQVRIPEGSFLGKIQQRLKTWTGIAPVIPLGRANTILPLQKPITLIVGEPIDVEKIHCPTQEQIDTLHETFILELTRLFEEHKRFYVKNWEDVQLEID